MLRIFDQPWTLVTIGAWLILAVLIASRFWPLKFTRKHLLIGPAVIVLAFALDYLLVTDTEKIEAIMDNLVEATQEERPEDIIKYISPNYSDSSHSSRESFAGFCRQIFSQPLIEKHAFRSQQLDIQKSRATVWITISTWFDQRSQLTAGLSVIKTSWRLDFSKQPDKTWLIDSIEPLERDNQPAYWTVAK